MIDELKALKTENAVLRSKLKGESEALTTLLREYDEDTKKHKESLAAARRECDLWKQIAGDLYSPLEERGFKCEPRMNGDHVSVCGTFSAENCPLCMTTALAAPADGEEGRR